jgi:hypothetical protein
MQAHTTTPHSPYDSNDMDAAVEYSKQTRQLFRDGKLAEAFAHYQQDPLGGASNAGGIATQERFAAQMYSMRDVQGEPLFPQPEGYEHGDLVVGMKVMLAEGEQWKRVRQIIEFEGHGTYVMVDGSTELHNDADLFASFKEPTAQQYAAVLDFSEKYGKQWKDRMADVWLKGDYSKRGIESNQAALLQQVRNECGPDWLANTKLDRKVEVIKQADTEVQYTVSIHSESWDEDALEAGEPQGRAVEVDSETLTLDELVREAEKYGIDSVSSPTLTEPYVWFKSSAPAEDREHFEQGINKFFALHIQAVDGKEPTTENYADLAGKFGVKLAPRHAATADSDLAPF